MAKQTLRIARKRHFCDRCGTYIEPREYYYHGKGKGPLFEDDDRSEIQIGIEYFEWKLHVYSCVRE